MLPPPLGLILVLVGIAFPMLEIAVLIKVGSTIGFWPTFLLILSTAMLGTFVLQQHGFVVIRRLSESLNSRRTPFLPLIEGGVMFVAGLCLIAPGLITDAIGLVLLIPWVRHQVAIFLHDRIWRLPDRADDEGDVLSPERDGGERSASNRPHRRAQGEGPIIEGEFERIDEKPLDPNNPRRR